MASLAQDKKKEIAFFDGHAVDASYDVFTAESSERLIDAVMEFGQFRSGLRLADLAAAPACLPSCCMTKAAKLSA